MKATSNCYLTVPFIVNALRRCLWHSSSPKLRKPCERSVRRLGVPGSACPVTILNRKRKKKFIAWLRRFSIFFCLLLLRVFACFSAYLGNKRRNLVSWLRRFSIFLSPVVACFSAFFRVFFSDLFTSFGCALLQ